MSSNIYYKNCLSEFVVQIDCITTFFKSMKRFFKYDNCDCKFSLEKEDKHTKERLGLSLYAL